MFAILLSLVSSLRCSVCILSSFLGCFFLLSPLFSWSMLLFCIPRMPPTFQAPFQLPKPQCQISLQLSFPLTKRCLGVRKREAVTAQHLAHLQHFSQYSF